MKIFSNTAISIDGKISTAVRDAVTLGTAHDLRMMSILRNRADAVLVGGNTFRNWPQPKLPKREDLDEPLRPEPKWNVVVSRKMTFDLSPQFLQEKRIRPLFITSHPSDRSDVTDPTDIPCEVVVSKSEITPQWIIAELAKRGVKNLLIEAGGDLIFQFLRDGFINEMYVTLCPKIIGGREAPTMVDGDGFGVKAMKNLKLLDHRVVGDEIFLHYAVK